MWLPIDTRRRSVILPRQEPPQNSQNDQTNNDKDKSGTDWRALIVAGVVIFLFLAIALGIYLRLRVLRKNTVPTSKHKGGNFLKRKLQQWNPRKSKGKYQVQIQNEDTEYRRGPESSLHSREMSGTTTETPAEVEATADINRNTSIRSIMTLPAYSAAVRENERILGREGDRAGIDVVVEHPENADEEESRREDEMESLYQIRVARRAEQADREDRRRIRREARERGDFETIARLRRETRERQENGGLLSASLIAEHQAATAQRERRVSSVQYAEVGVARHDGSRIRANSAESDNRPLLDGASSFGASQPSSGRITHHRDISSTSVLSNSTAASLDIWPTADTMRSDSLAPGPNESVETITLSRTRSPSGSRLTLAPTSEVDLGSARIPAPEEAPRYEEAGWEEPPPYTSPVEPRVPQLPPVERLPSIHVTATTPVDERSSQRISGITERTEPEN
ncbi:hypothetical protein HDK90DRAFT_205755 [Phyllosticta capitalensis]|uniref:Uncharacterized protein n=1 Tax=Phyllosticta capitalensis TaxID=121624 RepID=A0ABR1YS75_9PEZI